MSPTAARAAPSGTPVKRQRLDVYRRKRDFTKTPEPSGAAAAAAISERRFVVHLHHASHRHFDLRLQVGGALRSWAVPKGPSRDPDAKRLAVEVEDHPLDYIQFEGEIPAGEYGGGRMWIWDQGTWEPEGDPRKAIAKGHLNFTLRGRRLQGAWSLIRTKTSGRQPQWLLRKQPDAHTAEDDVADDTPLKDWQAALLPPDLGRPAPFPKEVGLQLAKLAEKAPIGAQWWHEVKYDGYRVLLLRQNQRVQIRSRGGQDWTAQLPQLREAVLALPCQQCILDGEIVAFDEQGHSRFDFLQRDFGSAGHTLPAVVFDLLYVDGRDLRAEPLEARRSALDGLMTGAPPVLRLADYIEGHGVEAAKAACAAGLEGIVCKDRRAPYREGRSEAWLKVKCVDSDEFVVVGYTAGKGAREALGSLLLAESGARGQWRYVGRVGSGLSGPLIKDLLSRLQPQAGPAKLVNAPATADLRGSTVTWVRPTTVVEVEHRGRTSDGLLRQAALKGLRMDKTSEDLKAPARVTRVPAELAPAIRLTHPERLLFQDPPITKQQLADFYTEIADFVLPAVARRPLSLVRCPDGTAGSCFFQKHATPGFPDSIRRIELREKAAKKQPYLYVEDLDGLLGLVQMGVLEMHVWGSTVEDVEHPDVIVMDLDPHESVAWKRVIAAARLLRERLERLSLQSFVRTSGGKGLHVVVPLDRSADWDTVKAFAHALAETLAQERPEEFLASASKAKREGRIFIDYLRNGRGATAISSYSLRARPGAPIATPLSWEELSRVRSGGQFTYANIRQRLARLRRDPWEGFATLRQALPRLN